MSYEKISYGNEYKGLSTDAKPAGVPIGSVCRELTVATGVWRKYETVDGTNWYETTDDPIPNFIADGADEAKGSKSDIAVTDPDLDASAIALLKGLLSKISKVTTTFEALNKTVEITRPADTTAYTSGDLINNASAISLPKISFGSDYANKKNANILCEHVYGLCYSSNKNAKCKASYVQSFNNGCS